MAEERNSENNVPEIVIDYDNSNILYEDDMDVASEVVVETYSHQQQENSVYACEVSTVQPLVYESYAVPDYGEDNSIAILANVFQNALPDEQREMLEIKSNPEGSGIFTTHSVEIKSDEVTVTTNSPQNRTDPIIDQKFLNEKKNIAITKEMSPDLQSELDPAPIEIDGVCHQTEMMNDEKPGASEGFNSAHHMLTRSAAKAAKSASHSAEEEKTQKKRKGSRANSTSSGDTSAHSLRASSSPKKMPKKPRCS
uniref:Uncharacterized protein n=1 Tax=Onchocerca volvulus TaxID=6282 RepID=A0A8R1XNR5_ONCVO